MSLLENCNVLVTGGAGFIGSHLTDYLLGKGHGVTIIDDLSTGSLDNIGHLLDDPRVKFIEGTILDPELVEYFVKKCDLIFHLAAVVGVKNVVDFPRHGIEVNVGGTEIVLRSAAEHKCRIVLASSSEVYGISTDIPFREDGDRVLGPTNVQRWSYAASKALDEHLGLTYAADGLPVSAVRYFNAYGPRIQESGYGSVIARFMTQAFSGGNITLYGDGSQTRSFTYVADTVRGTYLAGTHPDAVGEIFNIGSRVETSVRELATAICKLTNVKPVFETIPFEEIFGSNFQDIGRRVPCIDKAEKLLGFVPEISLEEGLKKTIAWARKNYKSANSTHSK
ncbi:MAG: GDP-mannose 4,6-dehydratase [bacterium]|nr:GDP-mannose 4,6-dehydratase [bacterium]